MDIATPSAIALVRAVQVTATPPTEAPRSVRLGTAAPGLQVAALAAPMSIEQDRRQSGDRALEEKPDQAAPLRSAPSLSDELGNRYQYKVAHEPDLDRPLLQIVDEKTDQIMASLPPEQLVRMLEDTKAMVEERLQQSHAQRLDTTA